LNKLSVPLQHCYRILDSIKTHKWSWPFLEPVDIEFLGIPDYFTIIKNPMDLGSVTTKLLNGEYETILEFAMDVRLVWRNCFTYNPPDSDIVKMAKTLDSFFEEKFKKVVDETTSESYQKKMAQMEKKIQNMEKELELLKPDDNLPTTTTIPTTTTTTTINKETETTSVPTNVLPIITETKKTKKRTSKQPDSRFMTFEEKKRLSGNISQLDSDKLARVVEIIQSRAPKASSQSTESEIEIDLDKLDAVTLRQVEKYVKTCLQSAKRKRKPKNKVSSVETKTENTLPLQVTENSENVKN